MSTQTQSVTQHALSRILELIREIAEKSTNGNCIYRGEPEHYDKVSSAHYRIYPDGFDSGKFNLDMLQEEILRNARNHIHDHEKEDFELLTELQHYGSQTSLIDFTTDLHIALFFACNGSHDKNGRIIVLPRTEEIDDEYRVKRPSKPLNRVLTQKSIFTWPHKGYIDHNDFIPVNVPENLKQWILIYLRKFQDISTQSIYNDLHGFIRDHNIRRSPEASLPLAWANVQLEYIADNNPPAEKRQTTYRKVIEDYTKTLQYSPYDVELYVKQSKNYLHLNEPNCAIEACSKAILLQSNYSDAYFYRGCAFFFKKDYVDTIEDLDYVIQENQHNAEARIIRGIAALHLQDWEKAKVDFEVAKKMGKDIISLFRQDSQSISDFEQKYNVKLPEDIAEMLTIP